MTKRSSNTKTKSKATNSSTQIINTSFVNSNAINISDSSSPINLSFDATPTEVISNKSQNNNDAIHSTDKDATITGSDSDIHDSHFESTSISTTKKKRKHAPSKNSNKKEILKQSVNSITTSTITIDHETSEEEEETVHESPKVSSIWKYAKRSKNKKYAICLLCDKHISTANWSTSSVRRHLIEIHNIQEVALPDDNKNKTSTISKRLKAKFHKLSVEAIIKDNLPFKAFEKAGLSKLLQEAIPEALNILHKINRIVTDGAPNLSRAISLININAQHIWCIGHRLHLAVTNALALWPKKRKQNVGELNQDVKYTNANLNNQLVINENLYSTHERSPTTDVYQHNQLYKNNHVVTFSNNKEVVGGGIIVEDDDVGKGNLFTDNNDNESLLANDDQHVEDYDNYDGDDEDYNDNTNDDDYDNDENSDNDHIDDKNDDDNNNDNDHVDDKNDDEDDDAVDIDDGYDDDAMSTSVNPQNFLYDNWKEDAEVDPNDPTLTKEQQLTLSVLIKCRKLIDMIRKSSILTLYFNKHRKELKKPRNVLRDVCTRWNSSYLMINSLKSVRPIIEKLYNDKHRLNINNDQVEKLNELEITSAEWNHLNQLHDVLQTFYNATKIVSGKTYPSMSSANFIYTKLKSFLMKDSKDNMTVKRLKKLLLSKMIHYFEEDEVQLNLLKSCIFPFQFHSYFDPTGYRALSDADKRSIEYDIKQMYANDSTNINSSSSSLTTAELVNSEVDSTSNTMATTAPTNSSSSSSSKTYMNKKLTAMEIFLNSVGDQVVPKNTTTSRATIIEELRNYRSLITKYNSQNRPDISSFLTFWKNYEFTLPYLFKLAQKFGCTPATSVPAESAFSTASFVYRKERSRLSAKNLEATVFLKVSIITI
ncbi:unnamed protein product [Rotaria sordida]|uniref:BED-type domain-containing protein n=1 Tax=Rotaria sordida TaxID=392033 RepID=A0A815E949_9BILA|nr:unnamed protein product [Rotaria sordida]